MKTSIKNLEDLTKKTTLYKSNREVLDNVTGEVLTSSSNTLSKETKREKFIKVFIDNLEYIIGSLTRIEKDTFWVVMQEMNYHNIIRLDSGVRKSIQAGLAISQGTVSKALKGLITKKVLLKISKEQHSEYNIKNFTDKEYLVNPQLVGQGSFRELSKMRTTITTSFDFEKLEIKQENNIDTEYVGLEDVVRSSDAHEIKEIKQNVSPDGKIKKTEVVITDRDKPIDYVDVEVKSPAQAIASIQEEPKTSSNSNANIIKLEIIKEQNKAKELDIEKAKIDGNNLKLQIQLHSIGKKQPKALFDDNNQVFIPDPNDEDL